MREVAAQPDSSVFRTVDAVGDAWSWLVLREASFYGIDRFDDFHARLGVARSTLSARLKQLTAGSVLQLTSRRYVLTASGNDFFACLMAAQAWGERWRSSRADLQPLGAIHIGCGQQLSAELLCSHCRGRIDAREVRFERRPRPAERQQLGRTRRRAPDLALLECVRPSALARTLQVVGDRWSALVIQECFFGVRRFDEFQRRLAIASNVLSRRLEHLVRHEVLERRPYQEAPLRCEYRLTAPGLDLYRVPLAMLTWGDRWLTAGAPSIPLMHRPCSHRLTAVLACDGCRASIGRDDVRIPPL